MNNKLLIILFVALLAVFGLTHFFSDKGNRSFKPEIIETDSTTVTSIVLRPKADSLLESILTKEGDNWFLSKNSKKHAVSKAALSQFFEAVSQIKTTYIAAKSKDKWPEYELEEGKASRITIYAGKKVIADFFVGKFSINQQARQITSFIRLADKDDVFAIEGMAGMMLGQSANAFRDKRALELDIHAIESLNYEGDAVYNVKKENGAWLLNGSEPLDSNKVRDFLMNLRQLSGDEFADGFSPETSQDKLLKTLTISGSNMKGPVVVRCWQDTTMAKPYVVQSSQFPESFFASDTLRIFKRVFKPVKEW
jgi:hypothetical protein